MMKVTQPTLTHSSDTILMRDMPDGSIARISGELTVVWAVSYVGHKIFVILEDGHMNSYGQNCKLPVILLTKDESYTIEIHNETN